MFVIILDTVTTAAGLECYVCSAKSPSADCMAGGSLQLAACEEDVTTCMHTVMANKTTNIPCEYSIGFSLY